MAVTKTVVCIFGSQDLDVNANSLADLRRTLLEHSDLQWIIDALNNLPQQWLSLQAADPLFERYAGLEHINSLVNWFRRGEYVGSLPLPNMVVSPLVVATQLAQFFEFVQRHRSDAVTKDELASVLQPSIQTSGLCTGLLSAAAVASARTLADVKKSGATALRLAMAIGAFVDAADTNEPRSSLVAGWKSSDLDNRIDQIVGEFPCAFIAVKAEARQVTITALKEDAPHLIKALRSAGFVVTQTSLRGAFHLPSQAADVQHLIDYFSSNADYRFPAMVQPMLSESGIVNGSSCPKALHDLTTRAMLCELANWHTLFNHIEQSDSTVVSFGRRRFIPQPIFRKLDSRLIHASDVMSRLPNSTSENDVAIIGMACHVPGGRDLQQFWETLCTGTSQHTAVPEDRIPFDSPWRKSIEARKWFGNFVEDYAAFDHKFFKKSAVEIASTDPQQRLIMQVAYQAVQQSGYFATSAPNTNVACYIGIGPNDYEMSVAQHEATAYTATGNLRSFAAGRISHYLGWRAPAVTIDTACSSSAVAIHEACKAIIAGECDSALAGGTNHLSGAEWFQNLAGASFLSKTGQCRPFDAAADGYCRSEGAGAIMLKKLSHALQDGDQVLAVVKATSVAQNDNCSVITAPTANSLSDNFRAAIAKSGLSSTQISLVEAHGTGTAVGDKAEYIAIRDVFSNDGRPSPITLGSAKGHIGHLESASGVTSVIKTILQMRHSSIPPQASHETLNPNLPATKKIQIATSQQQWKHDLKAALINNYGASGSNASIVLTEAPRVRSNAKSCARNAMQPFWLCAHQEGSLRTYAAKLAHLIRSSKEDLSIANLAFQTTVQGNRLLDCSIIFCSDSAQDLIDKLESYAGAREDQCITSVSRSKPRPVILAFGGQVSDSVLVSQELYESTTLFHHHLDHCDGIISSMGFDRIVPRVFDSTANHDVVQLQLTLFSVEYASAQSWIDSGLHVAAVVGHSFGELVAICISGALSLRDALWMVASRAQAIQRSWGLDSGCMLCIEADESLARSLLSDARSDAEVACINGPRSYTIAGTTPEIEQIQRLLTSSLKYSHIRSKRLAVTNAFHSKLVDSVMPDLQSIGEKLIWRNATIHHESATKSAMSNSVPGPDFVAKHMREPVFFDAAVQRLASRHPDAIWLEVGSGSGITSMASKALDSSTAFFQPINLNSVDDLAEATANLWKQGSAVSFWQHHKSQTRDHFPVLLPPYQFDTHVHWLERKEVPRAKEAVCSAARNHDVVPSLWTFLGYNSLNENRNIQEASFRINSTSPEFQTHVSAHVIAQAAPICPTGFQYKIATNAIASLVNDTSMDGTLRFELKGMGNHAPIVNDTTRDIRLIARRDVTGALLWSWRIESSPGGGGQSTLHAHGQVLFVESDCLEQGRMLARYERLVEYQQCKRLLENNDAADDVLQGQRSIYNVFSPMVHYNVDEYKSLRKIVAKGSESAGRVLRTKSSDDLNNGLADSFCQVAGIYANCMTDCDSSEMYVSNRLEHWIAPSEFPGEVGTLYDVYCRHSRPSEKEWLSDIFVFDPTSGHLLAAIFGMGFLKIKIASMSRMLHSLTGGAHAHLAKSIHGTSILQAEDVCVAPLAERADDVVAVKHEPNSSQKRARTKDLASSIESQLRGILCDMLGLEKDDIAPSSDLAECGVDSLLAMELTKNVQRVCKVELDTNALTKLTDFQSLVDAVRPFSGEEADDDCSSNDDCYSTESPHDSGFGSAMATPKKADDPGDSSIFFSPRPETDGLPLRDIVSAFQRTKVVTDDFVRRHKLAGFWHQVLPSQNELVLVHIINAFEKLGCNLRSASPGQILHRVAHLSRHQQVVDVFYNLLQAARIVDIANGKIIRTKVEMPSHSAQALLQELLETSPEHCYDHKLIGLCGNRLADCLKGEAEAVQILFGSAENRALVTASYAQSPIHSTMVGQLTQFFCTLVKSVDKNRAEPIKIMELGAGTGGTTGSLLPMLAAAGIPLQYTCTDLSAALVAGLRKRFDKQFPFTRFEVVNMETAPPIHLLHAQDVILATNCVHATKDISITTENIYKMLRPGGLLIMIEMTNVLPWVDMVFGLTEGWWLFNDGRTHACVPTLKWESILRANGFGYVDWTEGDLPESEIQQIIVAVASEEEYCRQAKVRSSPRSKSTLADCPAREASLNAFVLQHTAGFKAPEVADSGSAASSGRTVLVTGATGSLGAHLVGHLASLPTVGKVICLNRRIGKSNAKARQLSALDSQGLRLGDAALGKLDVLETDTATSQLGLSNNEYVYVAACVTDIVHSAWPMSLTRTLRGFSNQFRTMRNLINLARICRQRGGPRIGFQFIGSVATVGYHPYVTGQGLVPEEEVEVESAMPIGYAEAKLCCEKMLQETLRRYPADFRAMTVRLGQIAGSRITGSWNEAEHIAQMVKSSQTLGVLPDLQGDLSWCPVNDVAAMLAEVLMHEDGAHAIYHIENPVRQSWPEMIRTIATTLGLPVDNIIPFDQWLARVRGFPPSLAGVANPAAKILPFWQDEFVRMSCGLSEDGLVLDTKHTAEQSCTFRGLGKLPQETVIKYLDAWKTSGFLR